MRSFIVCSLLLAFIAASAQAGAVTSHHSRAVQYSCDLKGIAAVVKDIIADSIAVVFDLKSDLSTVYAGLRKCVHDDLTNPEALIKCVVAETKDEAKDAFNTIEQYVNDLKSDAQLLKAKLHQCSKF